MHESLVRERPRSFRVPPVFASAKKDSCMNLFFEPLRREKIHAYIFRLGAPEKLSGSTNFRRSQKDSCMNLVFGTFKERRSHNFRLSQKRFMHESFFGTSEKGKDSCMNL